jgi:hypothetical protein
MPVQKYKPSINSPITGQLGPPAFHSNAYLEDPSPANLPHMKFISLQPFVPSGQEFEKSKALFQELGFQISWDGGNLIGFERDNCKFILQKYDDEAFAQNLMISVIIEDAEAFWTEMNSKQLVEKFGIKLGTPTRQPYGKEVNIIDIAGVCWHFIQ